MGFFSKPKDIELETTAVETPEHVEEIPNLPTPLTSTVIASGLTISGTLEGEGVIQVEGVVKGEIKLNGAVIVTPTGSIEGPVTANVIQVSGMIRGNCVAREHMCLEKTGSLEGDVTTISLIVQDGGRLNGRSNMVNQVDANTVAAPVKPPEDLQFGPNYKGGEEEKEKHHKK